MCTWRCLRGMLGMRVVAEAFHSHGLYLYGGCLLLFYT
jgi:hypothetical protein